MKLTPNFTLAEMVFSETAARHHIDNTPSPEYIINLKRLALFAERVRSLLGGRPMFITSAYRCPELNVLVGSRDSSKHLVGLAMDFKVVGMTPKQVVDLLKTSRLDFDQLILEYNIWTHIGLAPEGKKPRGEVLHITKEGTKKYV